MTTHTIVGTAGHVDHGKSTVVRALTGTDPDRLREEKVRGITIDLGFAHTVDGDRTLSFVDVPGHEHFVRNMLAGVGGMSLVMLHVAADESVMPQTREHFDICRLLRVPAGIVVITKTDLVDEDTLGLVRLDIEELVRGSFLESAPVVPVSARTGAGLEDLRAALGALTASVARRRTAGPPRLPIDRVFTMRGFGTVVTGTLVAGRLDTDSELTLLPSGRQVKVRGVQVHGAAAERAVAGQRTAVNLAGVDVDEVSRGDTLTRPGEVSASRRVDVSIELLASAPALRHGARVRFHQGTRELIGRVVLPDRAELLPGATAAARLHLEGPAVLTRGDRFILRAYSPLATIGGGAVLDPTPRRRGIRTPPGHARLARLSDFGNGSRTAVLSMIEEAGLGGLPVEAFGSRAGIAWADREPLIAALDASGEARRIGDVVVARAHLGGARSAVEASLDRYHDACPLEAGMPREALRQQVFGGGPAAVFEFVLGELAATGRLHAGARVALAGRAPALTAEEARARDELIAVVRAGGLAPLDPGVLPGRVAAAPDVVARVADLLIRQGTLARAGGLLFEAGHLRQLKDEVRRLKQDGDGLLDVPAFKRRFGLTRKHAIPLLEYLDGEGVTRRVGNTRRVL